MGGLGVDDDRAEQAEASPRRAGRRRRRFARVLLVICLLVLALAALLWTQRRSIADDIVRRELERRGVTARYRVAEIGFGRQRLVDVVLGDPRAPDLVADWVEVDTRVDLNGAQVTGARVGQARLRATLRPDGTVSFGQIDRLLPPPSGKPFALPDFNVAVDDGRVRLATPYGLIGAKLAGRGNLANGFVGRLAAVSERLSLNGCGVDRLALNVSLRTATTGPSLTGPVRARQAACGEVRLGSPVIRLDAKLAPAFNGWRGQADVSAAAVAAPQTRVADLSGQIGFEGTAQGTRGTLDLASGAFDLPQLDGAGLSIAGRYQVGGVPAFEGRVGARGARLADAMVTQIEGSGTAANGLPVAPLLRAASRAAGQAARCFDLSADVAARPLAARLDRLAFTAANGARATLRDGPVRWVSGKGVTLNGTLATGGGGLPVASIRLSHAGPGAPVTGTAMVQPYAAGDSRLALAPVRFRTAGNGATQIETRAELSGPLGDGRVERLAVPIDARWDGGGRLTVNADCVPVAFDRLRVSALVLDATRLRLCPQDGGMLRLARGRVAGGVGIGATQLRGTLGGTPLALAASGGRFGLAGMAFTLDGVKTRLGSPERVSILDIGTLTGRIANGAVTGGFERGEGQIGNVPLLIREASGGWKLAGGVLSLNGDVGVRDAAPEPRFEPLRSDDFRLTLNGNDIRAGGTLKHPTKGVKVSDVTIAHDLATGRGDAVLDVPGIAFGDAFQPNELTRLTFGVIADVKGSVSGRGKIGWSPEGVTSTGVFRTAGTDLAAAFGPVTGLSGEIRFTDLLGLVSAPGQVATIAEVNPGIAVTDGVVRYRLIEGQRIQIEGGRWPLGGGEMILDPTILDFAEDRERRMTFRVKGVDGGLFLQQFAFDNLNASGTFDGVLPMIFDASGGRIEGGKLQSRGAGNLSYVGEVSKEDVGFWGNLAFQALKSMNYRGLTIEMDGPIAGEMVTAIRFSGVSQGKGTYSNFLIRRLARLPFVFNVRIKAPFRQLIDSVQNYYDPKRLIERNLPALQAEQRRREQGLPPAPLDTTIQPSESETVP
ncbi:intermembrane phospholipid transport protein YdbH family protein [Sphingomonas sp. Leaf62]|uniref:intermembrane phospholipid transport protein YdbH family protein n=1 Tax=Sphingomonas sp. Leaf62 TaxID=1736228 RepID=UPI001F4497ED|nr:YdbH domain-containing protein [Sphingomonas sp. Leaf62]